MVAWAFVPSQSSYILILGGVIDGVGGPLSWVSVLKVWCLVCLPFDRLVLSVSTF
jgi:hypothetical protein